MTVDMNEEATRDPFEYGKRGRGFSIWDKSLPTRINIPAGALRKRVRNIFQ